MTEPSPPRLTLLVLYTPELELCRRFYSDLGLPFVTERHGDGAEHYAAVLDDGTVVELYPARAGRETGVVRLGLAIDGSAAMPPLAPGRHVLTDPDGRTIDVLAS
jgi:catechol 2,3-dioxygenase-like lactoylglutathione lyase family enzyme